MRARVVLLVAIAVTVALASVARTWKFVQGTGQYAGLVGGGRSGHAGLGTPWYARYDGFLTSP
jgi:hypothetical protein